MISILSILIPFLTGLLIAVCLVVHEGRWFEWTLALSLAPGIGIAVSSVLYFFWMIIFQPNFAMPAYLAVEGVVLVGLAIGLRRFHWKKWKRVGQPWKKPQPLAKWSLRTWIGAGAVLMLALSFVNFIEDWLLTFFKAPYGNWDAWAIWNLHARFIDSGALWRTGFSPAVGWPSHPDYPLLLPGFIARLWAFLGQESPYVPGLVELSFLVAILGVVVSSIGMSRGWKSAVFAGLFTIPVLYNSLDFQQYADMELAFFFLGAILALWLADGPHKDQPAFLVLAGLMAGAGVWTKNEGWALVVAMVLVEGLILLSERPKIGTLFRRWAWLGLGFLIILPAVLAFKVAVPATNDLMAAFTKQSFLEKLTDLTRYSAIWQGFSDRIFSTGSLKVGVPFVLAVYPLIVGWGGNRAENHGLRWAGLRIFFILMVFFGIYILTPYPLSYHIATSMGRLITQVLPSLVLVAFLLARSLDEPATADAGLNPAA